MGQPKQITLISLELAMPKDSNAAPQLSDILAIFNRWQLSSSEQASILGLPGSEAANTLPVMADQLNKLPDTQRRLVLIESIDRSLSILYSDEALVRNWLRSPNSHELFNGLTALEVMGNESIHSLEAVATLLAAWSAGN